jgi:hypothetical protein
MNNTEPKGFASFRPEDTTFAQGTRDTVTFNDVHPQMPKLHLNLGRETKE